MAGRIGAFLGQPFVVLREDGRLLEIGERPDAEVVCLGLETDILDGGDTAGEHLVDGRGFFLGNLDAEGFSQNDNSSIQAPDGIPDGHLQAQGIPALTPAAGAGKLSSIEGKLQLDTNTDDDIPKPNGWPSNPDYPDRWCHSDMKDVAYFYNFKFYDKAIEKGNLK